MSSSSSSNSTRRGRRVALFASMTIASFAASAVAASSEQDTFLRKRRNVVATPVAMPQQLLVVPACPGSVPLRFHMHATACPDTAVAATVTTACHYNYVAVPDSMQDCHSDGADSNNDCVPSLACTWCATGSSDEMGNSHGSWSCSVSQDYKDMVMMA